MSKGEIEKRAFDATFTMSGEDEGIIEGVPIVFNQPTDMRYYREIIESGAITEEALQDVRLLQNHDTDGLAIARTKIPLDKKAGMELRIEADGVKMRARPNRERADANSFYLAVQEGAVDAMSFMFVVKDERWEDLDTDYPTRYITKIDPVYEVSAVNWAAYPQTTIYARNGEQAAENARAVLEKARKRAAATEKAEKKIKPEIQAILTIYGG